MWKCHNGERLLESPESKRLYLKNVNFGLEHESTDESLKLHCFSVMDNHTHQQMSYENGSKTLSDFMRLAHSRFGGEYNRQTKRTGAVLNDRPKTCLIGDSTYEMRVQLYIEANPIRAGMAKPETLRFIPWNSYRFYAYGIVDEYTKHLTPSPWYQALGKTQKERQAAYRQLFQEYVEQYVKPWRKFVSRFIGTDAWVLEREQVLKSWRASTRSRSSRWANDSGRGPPAGLMDL